MEYFSWLIRNVIDEDLIFRKRKLMEHGKSFSPTYFVENFTNVAQADIGSRKTR